jgi:hypothetical protein
MPHSAITRASIKQLTFAYLSMFAIIIGLICAGQVLMTIAHQQETQARALVVQLDDQQLRTQDMFYNVLILQSPGTAPGTTYMSVDAQVAAEEPGWEQVGNSFYTHMGDFPTSAQSLLKDGRANFLNMEAQYRSVLTAEKRDHPASITTVRPAIDTIYLDEEPYIKMLVKINAAMAREADAYTDNVRTIELILSIVCVLVVFCEAFFIARPAVKSFQAHMDLLSRAMHLEE